MKSSSMEIQRQTLGRRIAKNWELYVMLLPAFIAVAIFRYAPMYGIQLAFKNMKLGQEDIDRRVRQSAGFVGLSEELLQKSPFELSGGQKRRVAIAGVIAMEPEVLILDEPTAGLDPAGRDAILENIRAYHKANHSTIILVSHSMEELARSVERIVVVNDGVIPYDGTPREVFSHSKELRQMGLGIPQVTQVFQRLKELGLPIEDDCVYTMGEARDVLLRLAGKGAV